MIRDARAAPKPAGACARGDRRSGAPGVLGRRRQLPDGDGRATTAAATSTTLRATTTYTGPGSRATIRQYRSGNSTCVSAIATSVRMPATRCRPLLPTTTSATSGSVQQRNCGESTLLQTVKASTQARAATGMNSGAARSSARRRQIEHVDAGDEQQPDPDGEPGDELAAGAGQRLGAERVAGADAPGAPRPGDQVRRAGHALDLQRPLGVVGDDVGEPVEAAEERQERHDGEDEEAGEGVEGAPAGLRDDQHQRQQHARRELERHADAERGAGGGGVAPREEEAGRRRA